LYTWSPGIDCLVIEAVGGCPSSAYVMVAQGPQTGSMNTSAANLVAWQLARAATTNNKEISVMN